MGITLSDRGDDFDETDLTILAFGFSLICSKIELRKLNIPVATC